MNKHPQYKSERREQQRDRQRFQMRVGGRPEYLLMRVGGILRKQRKAYRNIETHPDKWTGK
jgi:hypothetical protein